MSDDLSEHKGVNVQNLNLNKNSRPLSLEDGSGPGRRQRDSVSRFSKALFLSRIPPVSRSQAYKKMVRFYKMPLNCVMCVGTLCSSVRLFIDHAEMEDFKTCNLKPAGMLPRVKACFCV